MIFANIYNLTLLNVHYLTSKPLQRLLRQHKLMYLKRRKEKRKKEKGRRWRYTLTMEDTSSWKQQQTKKKMNSKNELISNSRACVCNVNVFTKLIFKMQWRISRVIEKVFGWVSCFGSLIRIKWPFLRGFFRREKRKAKKTKKDPWNSKRTKASIQLHPPPAEWNRRKLTRMKIKLRIKMKYIHL